MAFVAGVIKIILIKWITTESREHILEERFCICKLKNVYDNKKENGQPNTQQPKYVQCHGYLCSFQKIIGKKSQERRGKLHLKH